MNSPNHILIGTIIYEYLKEKYGIFLNKASFLKGNTCPDHGISFLRPHQMRFCNRMVQKKTIKVCRADSKIMSAKASKKIGILCHYYADFFCFAHNPQFNGSLKEHVKYENSLFHFMYENYSDFRKIDYVTDENLPENAWEINVMMRNLFKKKPMGEHDYGMELVYAIQACAELVLSICLTILFPYRKTVGTPYSVEVV